METIQELMLLLLILIPAAGAVRIILCAIYMSSSEEETTSYKKRIRNTLVFIVLAETVTGVIAMIANYFGDIIY